MNTWGQSSIDDGIVYARRYSKGHVALRKAYFILTLDVSTRLNQIADEREVCDIPEVIPSRSESIQLNLG